MTRSFSSLSISNTLCLTSLWILVALGIYVTKMQNDQEKQDIHDFISKTNLTHVKNDTEINLPSYFLPAQSLKTISKSLIWLGFIMDNVVCFTEFFVIWLKFQATPCYFVFISVARYLYYIMTTIWYCNELGLLLFWTLCRFLVAIFMCCMNKDLYNEVDGILNNPVVYAVGPTEKKATAGA